MSYTKRYPGGFVDLPSQATAIDSQYLNGVEASLARVDAVDPSADGQVLQWAAATSKYGVALILDKNIDPAAGIAPSKLAGYPADATKFLSGAGTWVTPTSGSLPAGGATGQPLVKNSATNYDTTWGSFPVTPPPPRVTSLPVGPADQQECVYVADATNGVLWHLKYNAGSASAYKWEFMGGAAMRAEVLTDQAASGTGYVDLATVGPQLVLPLGGDYAIHAGSMGYSTVNAGQNLKTALKVGAAATVDADAFSNTGAASGQLGIGSSRLYRKLALAASVTISLQYFVASGPHYQNRWLEACPVRVG